MEHSEAEVLFDAVIRARVRHTHYFVHFVRAHVCVCVCVCVSVCVCVCVWGWVAGGCVHAVATLDGARLGRALLVRVYSLAVSQHALLVYCQVQSKRARLRSPSYLHMFIPGCLYLAAFVWAQVAGTAGSPAQGKRPSL